MPDADGNIQGVGDAGYLQAYLGKDISTTPGCPFEAGDPFEAHVVPDVGIILTPPGTASTVTLADLLVAVDADGDVLDDLGIDPETISLST